jgi:hypothetical protein
MKSFTGYTFWTSAALAALSVGLAAGQAGPDRKVAPPAKHEDSFLSGAPFTFEQVVKLSSQDAIPIRRRKEAIQERGIDFALTAEMLQKLKAAGVSSELVDLIKNKAKSSAPATVVAAAPRQGNIAITCSPGECEVALNHKALGSTKDGALEMDRLTPGKWTVDVQKEGYVGYQVSVNVLPDKTESLNVVLEPTRATQEAFGAELLHKVVQALGGDDGAKALASVQGVGSATVLAPDSNSVRWTLLIRNKPDRALFQVESGSVLYEVAFVGNEYKASKNMKGPSALELPTSFGLLRDYQLAAVMSRLESQSKVFAKFAEPRDGDEFSLFSESPNEKTAVALDKESRPSKIRITTETGIGSASITYGEYFKVGNAVYPKNMLIKAGSREQGIEVKLDSVVLNPKLNDNDYKLKGKRFVKSL